MMQYLKCKNMKDKQFEYLLHFPVWKFSSFLDLTTPLMKPPVRLSHISSIAV